MIRIYSKNDELKLKKVDIDFKNSTIDLGREYSDDIEITLKGCCGYDTIKKIIELKEKLSSTWSVDMHFGKEMLTYGRLAMKGLNYKFEIRPGVLPEESFRYEIRLAATMRKEG